MFHKNIYDYIDKYGNKTFKEKEFNELDNIIFSLLTYLNYSETQINSINNPTIGIIGNQYLEKYKYKEVSKYGISEKDAYKVLKKIIKTKRYKDIILGDYIYNNEGMQFSALTFKITNKLIYISFSGTDHFISSWKESFNILASFLVLAHKEAIKYLNKHIKLFGPKVIVGGHSKGGNLALVASIYTKGLKKVKIEKIYNNDGPGLRDKEFKLRRYQQIKKKYIHIVPNNSIFGILLRNEQYKVIKSKSISFLSHSMTTWNVSDDKLVKTKLTKKHQKLEKNVLKWIDEHNDIERKKTVDTIFDILDKCDIQDTMNLLKIKNVIKIIKELKNIDEESKKLSIEFIEYVFLNKKS